MDNFDLRKYLTENRLFEEEKGDIKSFLNAHIEEVKDYLRKLAQTNSISTDLYPHEEYPFTTDKEKNIVLKQIDTITDFGFDGSDEDVTPMGGENFDEVALGVSFNWPESPSLRTDGEEPEIIKIGGKDIGVKRWDY